MRIPSARLPALAGVGLLVVLALTITGPGQAGAPVVLSAPAVAPARVDLPRASRSALRTALVPVGPAFTGSASWYGGSFQGRLTANGEHFDTRELTAASRTLAFGTRLRVCRARRCVVVRVNDRGPYVGHRVLDLSHAAARRLGYEGVERVTATPVALRQVRETVFSVVMPPRAAGRPVVEAAAPGSVPVAGVAGVGLAGLVGAGAVARLRRRTVRDRSS